MAVKGMNGNLKWIGLAITLMVVIAGAAIYVEAGRGDTSTARTKADTEAAAAKREREAVLKRTEALEVSDRATQYQLGEIKAQITGLASGQTRIESSLAENQKRIEDKIDRLLTGK